MLSIAALIAPFRSPVAVPRVVFSPVTLKLVMSVPPTCTQWGVASLDCAGVAGLNHSRLASISAAMPAERRIKVLIRFIDILLSKQLLMIIRGECIERIQADEQCSI